MFKDLFEKQMKNQLSIKEQYDSVVDTLPKDDTRCFSYHMLQLMSELGEVLEADKRWKSMRNSKYDKQHKLEELADCYIVLMNATMFSGFDADDILNAIDKKLTTFEKRIKREQNK